MWLADFFNGVASDVGTVVVHRSRGNSSSAWASMMELRCSMA
jgi:hypothetical protein